MLRFWVPGVLSLTLYWHEQHLGGNRNPTRKRGAPNSSLTRRVVIKATGSSLEGLQHRPIFTLKFGDFPDCILPTGSKLWQNIGFTSRVRRL